MLKNQFHRHYFGFGVAQIMFGLLVLLGITSAFHRAHAADETQSLGGFTGTDFTFEYSPIASHCTGSQTGTISIGPFVIPSDNINEWNYCRGFVSVKLPEGLPSNGDVVLSFGDGSRKRVGTFILQPDPEITEVKRDLLGAGSANPITRVRFRLNRGIDDFYTKSLYFGSREVSVLHEGNDYFIEYYFEVPGSPAETELISYRHVSRHYGLSRFVVEPTNLVLPPTVTTTSREKAYVGTELSIYGYGFRGGPGSAGKDVCDLRVSIADVPLSKESVLSWKDTEIVIRVPDLNATGKVRVDCVKKDGTGTLSSAGNVVSIYNTLSDDPYSDKQRGLEAIKVKDAWKHTHGSREVVVAVIDSGVDTNSPDITDNIWTNADEIPGNDVDDDKNGYVDDVHGYDFVADVAELTPYTEHGTAVASVIGAAGGNQTGISGVNWEVSLMPLTVLNKDGGTYENVDKAIRYAADNGAHVINLSLGGPGWTNDFTTKMNAPIAYAYGKGVLVVAAAGNGDLIDGNGVNLDVNPKSPVCNDGDSNMVLGVGSIDEKSARSDFSDYGKCIDLVAPGEDVPVIGAFGAGSDAVVYATGTSFAAPFVSGSAALLKAAAPHLTGSQIRDVLMGTATAVQAASSQGAKVTLGAGLVNVGAAVAKVASVAPAAPAKEPTSDSSVVASEPAESVAGSVAGRMRGSILLQVQQRGEAWYVHPTTAKRHYMKDGAVAYQMMRNFGLGITDADLASVPAVETTEAMKSSASVCKTNATAARLKGTILLQVQQRGEAWYIDPGKCRRIYMKNGEVAYTIMRYLGLGITDKDLETIMAGN